MFRLARRRLIVISRRHKHHHFVCNLFSVNALFSMLKTNTLAWHRYTVRVKKHPQRLFTIYSIIDWFLKTNLLIQWQRSILGISWKGRITNVWAGQHSMNIFSERRLRWRRHVIKMDHQRIPRQALHWEVPGFKRGPSRPCTNWRSTVNKDLLRMGITWEEADVAAQNRSEWRWRVAQCIHLDAGWVKVKDTFSSKLVVLWAFYCWSVQFFETYILERWCSTMF